MCKAELWFLHMTHCLIALYNCMKFHSNSLNNFQLTEWTQNCIYHCPRGIILRIYKQELWFLCMTRCLNVLYKCIKFHQNIFNGYQVIEWTRFCDGQTYGQTDRRNLQARVMVLVHDTSSQCALQMHEVSSKNL